MGKPRKRLTTGILPPAHGEVLIVEDDQQLRETTLEVLALGGFMAGSAANGAEALRLIEKELPKLILLDLRMPVMDGWAFLRRRANDERLASVPVVIVSGEEPDPELSASVQGWISKPFEETLLVNTVAAMIATGPPAVKDGRIQRSRTRGRS
jgi:CheY-like chemotaxis protein